MPAQTTVIYNTWAIHHNDVYYKEHEKFIPERFLSENDNRHKLNYAFAQRHFNFGVGRRECPGQHVAETSLFIIISRLLWAFDYVGPRPSNGTGRIFHTLAPCPVPLSVEYMLTQDDQRAKFPSLHLLSLSALSSRETRERRSVSSSSRPSEILHYRWRMQVDTRTK